MGACGVRRESEGGAEGMTRLVPHSLPASTHMPREMKEVVRKVDATAGPTAVIPHHCSPHGGGGVMRGASPRRLWRPLRVS